MQQGSHIFLSYAKEDAEQVRRLHSKLVKSGLRVWLDEHDLLPGQDWEAIIHDAIQRSGAFVVLLSASAITKTGFVQKEIRVALDMAEHMPEGRAFVVPVRLEKCSVPSRLSRWQWLDLYERGGYGRLLRALRQFAPSAVQPPRSAEPPLFEDGAEQRLYEICRASGRLLHGQLGTNKFAFGQGHFMIVRKNFPKALRRLAVDLVGSKELTQSAVAAVLPPVAAVRATHTVASGIVMSTPRGLVQISGGDNQCYLDLNYWTLVALGVSRPTVYLRGYLDPVYFVEHESIQAVVMPRAEHFDDERPFATMT